MLPENTKCFDSALKRIALFIIILFVINAANALNSHGEFIDSIEIKKEIDRATTILHLGIPIRYLGHFPESEGRVLKIRFKPIIRKSLTNIAEESVTPPLNECPVIREITLDHGIGDDYYLTYHFQHSTHYTVTSQTDPQAFVVILNNPHIDEAGDPCDAH